MPETAEELVKLYTNTFISQRETDVPFLLLKIRVARMERIEQVARDVLDLVVLDNNEGVNLDRQAEKWGLFRQGKTDDELREAIRDQMALHSSGSTLPDFLAMLAAFDAPSNSRVFERIPPEDAEINVELFGSDSENARILRILNIVRAAGIELDSTIIPGWIMAAQAADDPDAILAARSDDETDMILM